MILVIDTSGPVCAAGIYDAGSNALIASISEALGKGHAERLIPMIDEVLTQAGMTLQQMTRIAVTVGPGSFTGIRVGVAAARGFALSLGIPAVGVTTLEVVAEQVLEIGPPMPVVAAIDARRDEIFAQVFAPDGEALTEPEAYAYEDVRAIVSRFDGILAGSGAAALDGVAHDVDVYPLDRIGRIGARLPDDTKASPVYIRGAGAKPQTGFAIKHL
ncbi:tRNA (adenosine(37)-N6)-threonylcarbamoyltransferase complex dimerization subunit type 1 TsaB [Rhizobium sp. TH2]|uniref:tRNA (adenosine(37)-N6)-threonylcarbamoyltransferase complex dimerization subunit type 1 TsaB n=1 Tax=Rhizobium sp. TH2 TaxID=2775403 RepID=UPI0021578F01|nr:tRNA (adenosine(37)-N6)-threonylcarbamoyltransferase complex dimerization subunit type 1 TsaB [Rhizobium sp. TH2]UVC08773.1 tRNA (adenosine(37)-N6)-threonylcarbamoyltransferase complex dimerization subunit type 1 TsaB [Rhizobium sp. TH2]